MEQSQNIKTISAVIVIVLILVAGYFLFGKNRSPEGVNQQVTGGNDQEPMVVVEKTPLVNGVLSIPTGFPEDIPIERSGILESATTQYPDQNAKQLSVSYRSSRTVTQKYAEYKNYISRAGYDVTEGDASSAVRSIFGTKEGANLSVVITSSRGRTLVQLSYLLKSL